MVPVHSPIVMLRMCFGSSVTFMSWLRKVISECPLAGSVTSAEIRTCVLYPLHSRALAGPASVPTVTRTRVLAKIDERIMAASEE